MNGLTNRNYPTNSYRQHHHLRYYPDSHSHKSFYNPNHQHQHQHPDAVHVHVHVLVHTPHTAAAADDDQHNHPVDNPDHHPHHLVDDTHHDDVVGVVVVVVANIHPRNHTVVADVDTDIVVWSRIVAAEDLFDEVRAEEDREVVVAMLYWESQHY